MSIRLFLAVAVIAVVVSCDYEPSGENFVALLSPDASGMSVELTETTDTIFAFGNAEIRFKSITSGKAVRYISTFLNGQPLGSQPNGEGSFFIYTNSLDDGCYKLRIVLTTSSGTGSIADLREKEDLTVSNEYVLCISNTKPKRVAIRSIRRMDGTLELVWDKSSDSNFQKYKIFKYCYNQGFKYYEAHWIKEITSKQIHSLRDSSFIGGKAKYVVSVIGAGLESDVSEQEFEDPYDMDAQWQWVDKTNIKFTWRKTPYYKNFTAYAISFGGGDTDTRIFESTKVNDTTLVFDAKLQFPRLKYANVIAYPFRVDTYHADYVYANTEFHLGDAFPWYKATVYEDKSVFNVPLQRFFAMQQTNDGLQLIRIDPATRKIEQSIAVPDGSNFLLSENGQYLFITKGDNFTRLDPQDLSILSSYDISALCGSNGGNNWLATLSGDNRLAVTNINGSYVLEMNSFSVLKQWPYQNKPITISPTGLYVVRGRDLLKFNGTQYQLIGTVAAGRQLIFIKNDEKVLLDDVSTLEVFNLNTLTYERSIRLQNTFNIRYDPVSGLVGGITDPYSGGPVNFYLFSLDSNEAIKTFAVADGIVLMNNSLVTPGFVMPLSFYYP